MRASLLYGLATIALLAPIAAAGEEIPPSYVVTASHPQWGSGIGHLWGGPDGGVFLELDMLSGYGRFWFTVYGDQDVHATPVGDVVVDDWIRVGGNGPERFIASHHLSPDGSASGAASGGGKLNQFVITVHAHT